MPEILFTLHFHSPYLILRARQPPFHVDVPITWTLVLAGMLPKKKHRECLRVVILQDIWVFCKWGDASIIMSGKGKKWQWSRKSHGREFSILIQGLFGTQKCKIKEWKKAQNNIEWKVENYRISKYRNRKLYDIKIQKETLGCLDCGNKNVACAQEAKF
jgi:hypothetical protein